MEHEVRYDWITNSWVQINYSNSYGFNFGQEGPPKIWEFCQNFDDACYYTYYWILTTDVFEICGHPV